MALGIKDLLEKVIGAGSDALFKSREQEPESMLEEPELTEPVKKKSFFARLFGKKNRQAESLDFPEADSNAAEGGGERNEEREGNAENGTASRLATYALLLCLLVAAGSVSAYVIMGDGQDESQPKSGFHSFSGGKHSKKAGSKEDSAGKETPVQVAYGNVMINPFVDIGEMRKSDEAGNRRDNDIDNASCHPDVHASCGICIKDYSVRANQFALDASANRGQGRWKRGNFGIVRACPRGGCPVLG